MKSRLIKFCCMLITMALLLQMLPMQVLGAQHAVVIPEDTISEETMQDHVTQVSLAEETIVDEIVEKRTRFSKDFLLSSGLNLTIIYPEAVHYEENNTWKEIDNTLKPVGSGTSARYINTAGEWTVSFPQQIDDKKVVTISRDGYALSFGLAGKLSVPDDNNVSLMAASRIGELSKSQFAVDLGNLSNAVIEDLDFTAMRESMEYPETFVDTVFSQLKYINVYDNTDIVYDLNSKEVKESIVIETYDPKLYGYQYTLNTGTMVPVLEDDGSISLYSPDYSEIVMTMPAPYMIDSAGAISFDVGVTLEAKGSGYTLAYHMPVEWLAEKQRVWPVVLDPVVVATSEANNILDQTIMEHYALNYTYPYLYVGYETYNGKMWTFMQYVDLPELSSGDVIVNADVSLYRYDGTNEATTIEVHKVNNTWTSSGITWANKPTHDPIVEDYAHVDGAGRYSWDVTDIARGWYEGENTGLMFKATDAVESGNTNNWKNFYSIDFSIYATDWWPYLSIRYRNNSGLESYWDYTVNGAGRAGTGYINNYSGNLVWVHNDIGFGGNLMPVSINHIYNSNDNSQNSFGMGNGWRTNFNQTLQPVTDSNINASYVWEDGDGTEHYFYQNTTDNIYYDEDNLDLKLTVSSSGYCITDETGNTSYFNSSGKLIKIENNQAVKSSIDITYNGSGHISRITDGAGRKYNFNYSNGLLESIKYVGKSSSTIAEVKYIYDNTNLYKIIDNGSHVCLYEYTGGFLTDILDVRLPDGFSPEIAVPQGVDGYKLEYAYSTTAPKRVVSVAEYDQTVEGCDMIFNEYGQIVAEGGPLKTAGGVLTFAYSHNQTVLKDHNNTVEILQFNDWGNLISVQNGQGQAQFMKYVRNDHSETTRINQLSLSSNLQYTVKNLLDNSSFEDGSLWPGFPSGTSVASSAEAAYIGNKSMKIVGSTTDQSIGVYKSSYPINSGETITFSAYIKTVDAAAILKLETNLHPIITESEVIPEGTDWQRYQVSFTNELPYDDTIDLYIQLQDAGTIYVDCVQLEYAPTAGRYNLIQNGDFTNSTNWSSTAGKTTVTTPAAPQLDNHVYTITGNPNSLKAISQAVPVSGAKDDAFILAGWAKADSAPLQDNRTFGLKITFKNGDTEVNSQIASFNADYRSAEYWQYTATPAIADGAYTEVVIQLLYDENVNTAYFDGIQLYKETFGNVYTYNDDGKLISVVDLQKQTTTYKYENNNLTEVISPSGTLNYDYDNYHNVITATSQSGEVYTFTYDTYGNNTSVSVGSGTQKITTSATYTDDKNQIATTIDALGAVTTYQYNENTNVLEWVRYPGETDATRTNYTYDSMYRLATSNMTTDANNTMHVTYTYTHDNITQIDTASTTYYLTYGDFDLLKNINMGMGLWFSVDYTYTDDQNHYLSRIDYGNGGHVQYTYDSLGRVIQETYETGETVSYLYDNSGALATVKDSDSGLTTTYYYDFIGRTMKYVESKNGYRHSVSYDYDLENMLTSMVETINGVEHTTSYTYDASNRVRTVVANGVEREYTYDAYGRVTQMVDRKNGNVLKTVTYTYRNTATGTTTQIASMTTVIGNLTVTYTYTYDVKGNILSVSDGTYTTSYAYDSANQLIRENNQEAGKTWTYTYDAAGNITSCSEYAFTTGELGTPLDTALYENCPVDWGDMPMCYDGVWLGVDSSGNMPSDGVWNYTWEKGRELARAVDNDNVFFWDYTYDANGMRIRRDGLASSYSYTYVGSQLTQMTTGSHTFRFAYDAAGIPVTVIYNGTTYYYLTNLQGDIVGITDEAGVQVVTYTYDAWGKPLTTTGTLADTLGLYNPLRYRGYVYDTEIGLYYLQSRYYSPTLRRFISADAYLSTGQGLIGHNMFAYCNNNPVNMSDTSGHMPQWITDLAIWVNNNIVQPVANFVKDIAEDIKNYDLNNQSEEKVLESNYFSSYKGKPVIRTNGDRSGSFGAIFLTRETNNRSNPEDIVRHEYGHTKQLEQLGVVKFALCIGLPSWQQWGTGEYYSKPWEITADIYGGVQSRNHSQSSIDRGFSYLQGSKIIGPLIWAFIE